jgi:hypothetical protein
MKALALAVVGCLVAAFFLTKALLWLGWVTTAGGALVAVYVPALVIGVIVALVNARIKSRRTQDAEAENEQ